MKFTYLLFIPSFVTFLFFNSQAEASTCTYTPDPASLEVHWTGFKTTQKVAVPGQFLKVKNMKELEASYPNLKALLRKFIVQVDITSANTGNPPRDATLKEKFFSVLSGNRISTAYLTSIKETSQNTGTASMVLRFNKKVKKIPVTYTFADGKLNLKGNFDILSFSAYKALNSLNQACLELHKGADGVSKTWSEVEFMASGKVIETCKEAVTK